MNMQSTTGPRRMSPWVDARGTVIREGDQLKPIQGRVGIVVYVEGADMPWQLRYEGSDMQRLLAVEIRAFKFTIIPDWSPT